VFAVGRFFARVVDRIA